MPDRHREVDLDAERRRRALARAARLRWVRAILFSYAGYMIVFVLLFRFAGTPERVNGGFAMVRDGERVVLGTLGSGVVWCYGILSLIASLVAFAATLYLLGAKIAELFRTSAE